MEGAKMVDKTNMSLDDIIKMDRKKGKAAFSKNKNSMARNVVKKARNSIINKKPLNKSPKKKFPIAVKRQDARSKLIKAKQLNNTKKVIPQNIQRTTRNSNFQRPNRTMNINSKQRINSRINSNPMRPVPAFRITTNNERYQSNNQRGIQYERSSNKRLSNNNNFNAFPNRIPYYPFPTFRRPMNPNEGYYPISNRNGRSDIRRNPILARDREYEAMARALIEAHRESRYTFNQPTSSQRRYNQPMESRGYPYRR